MTYHLIDTLEVTSPTLSASIAAFGMPPVLHYPTEAAHRAQEGKGRPLLEDLSALVVGLWEFS